MKPHYTDWIELYIEDDLSMEERRDFENELEINPQLREEYALHTALEDYIAYKARMREMMNSPEWKEIEEDVEQIVKAFYLEELGVDVDAEEAINNKQSAIISEQDSDSLNNEKGNGQRATGNGQARFKGRKKGKKRILVWLGAAVAVIALMVVVNVSLMTRPPETEVLFAEYVEEVRSETVRSSEESPYDVYGDILLAIEQYESNDYEAAIATFETLEPWGKLFPEISLFRGLVHLELGENAVALVYFKDCAEHKGPYRKYARWLRNLAYVRLVNPDAAFMYFIERSDGFHNLPSHWQKMIRSANLIGTGQFKAYREFVNPDAEGPIVLHRDDIFWGIVFFVLFLMALSVWIDLIRLKIYWKEALLPAILQVFIPLGGPIVYYFSMRKEAIERTLERKDKELRVVK